MRCWLLRSRGWQSASPSQIFEKLTHRHMPCLPCNRGEQGPFAQAIAGIDLAVWDLYARRSGKALWKLLGGNRNRIKVYASGINPTGSRQMAEAALERGHRALKLKVGFEPAADRANLASLRELDRQRHAGGRRQPGLVDRPGAGDRAVSLAEFDLAWLEEPIRADRPWEEWQALRRRAGVRRLPPVKTSRAATGSTRRSAAMCCGLFNPISPNGAG